jgi:RNA polymerase sigma factor (sigma-70 family)
MASREKSGTQMSSADRQQLNEELVPQAQQGSHSAFTRLVEMHREPVLSYLLVRCGPGDRDRAEDITQETFLKAWTHIQDVDTPAGFRAWLLTIARNLLYNDHRWRKNRPFISFDRLLAKIGDHLPRPFRSPDPNETYPEQSQVMEVLHQMPESLSEPLILSRGFQMTSVEIAEVMGLSPVAVRTRIHRAEQMFRNLQNADDSRMEASADAPSPL